MKTLLPLSVLMLASTVPAWSRVSNPTPKSMMYVMQEVRDPYLDSAKRKHYLQMAQTFMQKQLAQELNTVPDNLGRKFVEDQTANQTLMTPPWKDLQSEFYTTLHQEVLYQRWQTQAKKNDVTDYGKKLADSMVGHVGKFSPVKEARFYTRWSTVSKIEYGKNKTSKIPYFVFGPTVSSMLSMDAYTAFEDLLPREKDEAPSNPSLQTFLKNVGPKSRDQYQELAEKTKLNHLIYIRAVANSAKTIASIHYLTGEYSLKETENKVGNFLGQYCEGCSQNEKTEYLKGAMAHTLNSQKTFSQSYTAESIVTSFCSALTMNHYVFDEKPAEGPMGKIVIQPDNTRVDRSAINTQIIVNNLTVLNKTINEHDLGVLFLTNSLSRLSLKGNPSGTNLACKPESRAQDTGLIKGAIQDARLNVEQYITRINSKLNAGLFNPTATDETLEYFTQTNVSATAEALMGFPQGMKHVVDTILLLDKNVKRRQNVDAVVAWGGTIIGIGLAVSGIGAPEGVALLIAVAGMAKGAVFGSYYLIRTEEEKTFYKELLIAKKGTNVNFYLDGTLSQHYEDYRNMRINYIVEFAQSAMSFAKIHKMALEKADGDVVKAHGLIKKSLAHGKAIASEVGEDQFTQYLISLML